MADVKDSVRDVSGSRASTALTNISVRSLDAEDDDDRDASAELPSPSSTRMSNYSDVSTVSFRTFYPPPGYPEDVMASGYPDNGYPDTGYPTETLYPKVEFPVVEYPQAEVPLSPYPTTPLPETSYPPTPTLQSPYPSADYPDYSRSETTSLVFSEDLGLSRDSSEVMHPMSAFIDSNASPVVEAEHRVFF